MYRVASLGDVPRPTLSTRALKYGCVPRLQRALLDNDPSAYDQLVREWQTSPLFRSLRNALDRRLNMAPWRGVCINPKLHTRPPKTEGKEHKIRAYERHLREYDEKVRKAEEARWRRRQELHANIDGTFAVQMLRNRIQQVINKQNGSWPGDLASLRDCLEHWRSVISLTTLPNDWNNLWRIPANRSVSAVVPGSCCC